MSADLAAELVVERSSGFVLDADLNVAAGTTAALLGPNGSGKSTTVALLAGLVALGEGQIRLGDRLLDDPGVGVFVPPEQRRVGVVFQRYLLFEHLDVADNVAFGPAVGGRGRRRARAEARVWLERLGLVELAERRPSELSGGQAQRVALARTLAAEPQLLLLDEPLSALDVTSRAELRRVLRTHLDEVAGPRLLITHDPADAFLLADRIYVLEQGRITQSGTAEEIRSRPATAYVAALAGLNLLAGSNRDGTLTLTEHPLVLHTADTHTGGSVLITIAPNAIAVHLDEPHGSPRNTWPTRVAGVEELGEITRVTLGDPLPVAIDITPGAARALSLAPGRAVWASVKATEVMVHPA